jgi:hypothetical protein
MKSKLLFISIALVAMVICIGGAIATSDLTPPRLPCEYYGDVTIGGVPAPVGTVIIAKIGDEGVGYTQTTVAGIYGNILTQYSFGTELNPVIDFYINGDEAQQNGVFYEGGAIRLDLSVNGSPPTPTPTPTPVPTPVPTPTPDPTSPPITKVTGKIIVPEEPVKTVTITPPGPFTWNLDMTNPNNNEIVIGDAHVTANCNYILSIQGSTGGYMIGTSGEAMSIATLHNPVLVYNGASFLPIERFVDGIKVTSLPIYTGTSGDVNVPIKLQQIMDPSDADKVDPTIVFTYLYATL